MPTDHTSFDGTLSDIIRHGALVADKYRIDRVIGVGGMGVVVQAFHLHFDERVAIKFLLPQLVDSAEARLRFEREARAAFKIKSEHVARVIDVGTIKALAVPYMVMEYLDGVDMADVLAAQTRLSIDDAIDYIMQAAEAVGEAHTLGIVHRDLKPENLFLTYRSDGTACIKVLDFGLSKLQASATSGKRERALTSTTQPMGTPQYMSPEQWMSAKDVGPATDIWALGVMLYEFCTGLQPFQKDRLPQLCSMVLQGEPESMRALNAGVPPALEGIVRCCLAKRPEDRYRNVAELALDLHRVAPERVRVSARRIAGVFRRVGIDPGESPPPSGAGMPAPLRAAGPRTPFGPPATLPTAPAPAFEWPAQRADSATLVMAEPAALDGKSTLPMAESAVSSESGRFPAVPAGHAGSSGRYPAHADEPSTASGEYRAVMPPMTVPSPPPYAAELEQGDRTRRAVTAQSWQHVLEKPPGASSSGKRLLVIVAAAAGICTLVALIASLGGGEGERAPGSVGEDALVAPTDAAEEPAAEEPPPPPSATASASASAPEPAASLSARARPPGRRAPVVRPKASPPPPPSPTSIFDRR
jgi:serine/threonine-protein kinase